MIAQDVCLLKPRSTQLVERRPKATAQLAIRLILKAADAESLASGLSGSISFVHGDVTLDSGQVLPESLAALEVV